MKAPELLHPSGPGPDTEAVIREARRHQRKRHAAVALAVVAAVAALGGVFASVQGQGSLAPPGRGAGSTGSPARGPAVGRIATTLLMWPAAWPGRGPCAGYGAYLDDLSTRRLLVRNVPCIVNLDVPATLLPVGRWVVYMNFHGKFPGNRGASALPSDLAGRPRLLGNADYIAPSASPGRVWLMTADVGTAYDPHDAFQEVVRSVSAASGQTGPAIKLPQGTSLVEGTQAGLLLSSGYLSNGYFNGAITLWTPGARPRHLAYLPPGNSLWFAADAQLIAFGTGCRLTSDICKMLQVVNVVTGRRLSFPAPPGTLGWTPRVWPGGVGAISPLNTMIAAQAATRPARKASAELFILRLAGARKRLAAVPQSAAPARASMAWSAGGSWLFYQGPGGRLRALQVATGKIETFGTPTPPEGCCQYQAMFPVPKSP
jgi:hypothetical protein